MAEGSRDYEAAREVSKKLAAAGFVICNGGYGGMMEASARGAKEGGGQTTQGGKEGEGRQARPQAWTEGAVHGDRLRRRLVSAERLGEEALLQALPRGGRQASSGKTQGRQVGCSRLLHPGAPRRAR